MKKLALIIFLALIVLAVATVGADAKRVNWQGKMLCMGSEAILQPEPQMKLQESQCNPAFVVNNGTAYTLVGSKIGSDLRDIAMRGQRIQVRGHAFPKSRMIEVTKYNIVDKARPDNDRWWWQY
jgi:hypothetical protein